MSEDTFIFLLHSPSKMSWDYIEEADSLEALRGLKEVAEYMSDPELNWVIVEVLEAS